MDYKIEVRSIWEYGQRIDENGNPHQEDCLFPVHGQCKESDRVFILCDGMGGHAAGEVASAAVCDTMSGCLLPLKADFSEADMAESVSAAYDALDALDDNAEGKGKMGTTMTCLVLHEGGITIAHMGDSRVYHIRPGQERENTQILFQTRDHSLVSDLVAIGEITPEEAKTHPRKNVITRALQPHVEHRQRADIKTIVDVKPGDWFYMCSDGMLEQMDDHAICFIFSNSMGDIDNKTDMLTKATRENRDNHTAFLIHVVEVENPLPVEVAPTKANIEPIMGQLDDDIDEVSEVDVPDDKTMEVDMPYKTLNWSFLSWLGKNSPVVKIKTIMLVLLAIAMLLVGGFAVHTCANGGKHPHDKVQAVKAMEKKSNPVVGQLTIKYKYNIV